MRNRWKSLCRLLVVAVTVGMMTGCGGIEATEDTSETVQTEAVQESSAEKEEAEEEKTEVAEPVEEETTEQEAETVSAGDKEIPVYAGEAYTVLQNNEPQFSQTDMSTTSYEMYGDLDAMGRCTAAMANIGIDLMPTEERDSIGQVKPTGWHTVKYDVVDGKYLYNRCHLIGYQLTAENANEKNLITGTRYLNVEGMLPFENMVADYIRETENHVLYRVTPVYDGENLVASGVEMEAYSVEDEGDGICFHVFVHNIQPGVSIDYKTGESCLSGETIEADTTATSGGNVQTPAVKEESEEQTQSQNEQQSQGLVIRGNSKSKIYHCPGQADYEEMADSKNLVIFHSEQEAINKGYRKAKR